MNRNWKQKRKKKQIKLNKTSIRSNLQFKCLLSLKKTKFAKQVSRFLSTRKQTSSNQWQLNLCSRILKVIIVRKKKMAENDCKKSEHNEQEVAAGSCKRTALVTGSSNGIGEAIVKQLARLDYKLIVTGRNSDDIVRVASECERLSPSRLRPLEIVANLELDDDVKRMFDSALDHFDKRLDLLVNNAGFSSICQPDEPPERIYANFKRIQQVNMNSAVYLTLLARESLQQTARALGPGKPTSVINVSSIVVLRPLQDYAYCVSKAAMSMFSNCMSSELGPLVRVNCIVPGPIETKIIERTGQSLDGFKSLMERMTPLGRIGQAHEVAEAVVFLADPERASYISGSQLTIDGGTVWATPRW